MADLTYAVHTATCTYLLDDDGICRWTHAPMGQVPPGAERCVGAQFVACLDMREEGGLVGELRIGASALFAREEGGRLVLLRTLPIEHVEIRPHGEPIDDPETPMVFRELPEPDQVEPEMEPLPQLPLDPLTEPFPESATPVRPFPAFSLHDDAADGRGRLPPTPPALGGFAGASPPAAAAESFNPEVTELLDPRWSDPGEPLDLEDLLSISVTEVTLSLPLYRAPQPAHAALPPPNPPPPKVSAAPVPPQPPVPRPPPEGFGEPLLGSPSRPAPRRGVVGPGRRLR